MGMSNLGHLASVYNNIDLIGYRIKFGTKIPIFSSKTQTINILCSIFAEINAQHSSSMLKSTA